MAVHSNSVDTEHAAFRTRHEYLLRLAIVVAVMTAALCCGPAAPRLAAQNNQELPLLPLQPGGQTAPPLTVTLQDALERAGKNDAQFLSALTDVAVAREDRVQARASYLPSIDATTQALLTQGNGVLPTGRFVTNNGVHVYRAWGIVHQDVSGSTLLRTGLRRATSAEALANARAEIARRGLTVTVTRNYYALAASQRKYSTAQQALQQARRFFEITQQAERVNQVAHSDVVKAEIQFQQQSQAFEEARLAMENDRLNLAVLLFATLNENFTVVDDLDAAQAAPQFPEIQAMAERQNPDLRVAMESLRQSELDVTAARTAFFPSLTLDADYGIEANAFALRSRVAGNEQLGKLPNLGFFITAGVTVPVWNWGVLRSRLHQSEFRRRQAQVELSRTQRQLLADLYAFYNEATVARSALATLRRAADLAAESLRLVTLRYQAGESTALEVVDAQNTFTQARNSYDDAQVRFRVSIANLQTLTGPF